MVGTIERYLACIAAHDWGTLAECIADDIVRVGPYGDTYAGKSDYLAFIEGLMPTLPGYGMEVHRIIYSDDALHATAELTETVTLAGGPHATREAIVFDLTPAAQIQRIHIYLRQSGAPPPLAKAPSSAPTGASAPPA